MASPRTWRVGQPCHMRCTPWALNGLDPHEPSCDPPPPPRAAKENAFCALQVRCKRRV